MADRATLIGIDWGTSAFRAFRIDAAGGVLDRRTGPRGILSVESGDFAGVIEAEIGDWLATERVPVIMSGMIGSRQGWVEAPYVTCPAGLADLAAGLVRVPFDGGTIYIVPGMETATATMRDVMRGEETQVLGALVRLGVEEGRFLLPGTHSKWVLAEFGRVVSLSTYMTGEIYAACRSHTILGRLMSDEPPSGAGLLRGVREGVRAGTPGALLHRLFGVRTAGLFSEIAAADLADYLSGMLIGAELADSAGGGGGALRIIASDRLAERYRAAAADLGIAATTMDSDCVVAGLLAIAQKANLVAEPGG